MDSYIENCVLSSTCCSCPQPVTNNALLLDGVIRRAWGIDCFIRLLFSVQVLVRTALRQHRQYSVFVQSIDQRIGETGRMEGRAVQVSCNAAFDACITKLPCQRHHYFRGRTR